MPGLSYLAIQTVPLNPKTWPKQAGKRGSPRLTSRSSSEDPGRVRSHLSTNAGSRWIRHRETAGDISRANVPIPRGAAAAAAPPEQAKMQAAASPKRDGDDIGPLHHISPASGKRPAGLKIAVGKAASARLSGAPSRTGEASPPFGAALRGLFSP